MMLCKLFKMKSIMTNSDQEEEMVILSSHILRVWQEVVQAGQMDRLGNVVVMSYDLKVEDLKNG